MAVSTSLKYHGNKSALRRLWSGVVKSLNTGTAGTGANRGPMGKRKKFCQKAGVPGATDTPIALYDLCEDTTNGHWYLNTVYDATSVANTWTQLF